MMPALIISSPARMKNGIDISGKALTALIMRVRQHVEVDVADQQAGDGADRPSENASGMPSSATPKKTTDDQQAHSQLLQRLRCLRAPGRSSAIHSRCSAPCSAADRHRHDEPGRAGVDRGHQLVPLVERDRGRLPATSEHQRRARSAPSRAPATSAHARGRRDTERSRCRCASRSRMPSGMARKIDQTKVSRDDLVGPVERAVEAVAQRDLRATTTATITRHRRDQQPARRRRRGRRAAAPAGAALPGRASAPQRVQVASCIAAAGLSRRPS